MRILVVEDDRLAQDLIAIALKSIKYDAEYAATGEEAKELLDLYTYDLLILDLMLPDTDGVTILRELRAKQTTTPVLILSGLDSPDKKVLALTTGADTYMTKPFHPQELLANIQAIIRRSQGHATSTITVGDLFIDVTNRIVKVANTVVALTKKEFSILEILALRGGRIMDKKLLLERLYGGFDTPEPKIIDVFVCKLRKKLMQVNNKNYIQTAWGSGYCLKDPTTID